jgi:hypothetical protein
MKKYTGQGSYNLFTWLKGKIINNANINQTNTRGQLGDHARIYGFCCPAGWVAKAKSA